MKLPMEFYLQDTKTVAQKLLGKKLVHVVKGKKLSGLITETEAYLGVTDLASHAFGDRRTSRTEPMYLEGGHSYVYFIYGMYFCFNVVTEEKDNPTAVLIRGIHPLDGIESMKRSRGKRDEMHLADGPGKLCQALQITKSHNGLNLRSSSLYIEETKLIVSKRDIEVSPRIGVSCKKPLRYKVRRTSWACGAQ